jgi:Na+-driven multidrug efflux pump
VRGLLVRMAGMQLVASSTLALVVYTSRDFILEAFHVPAAWQGDARRALEISVVGFVVASLANLLFASIQGLQRTDRALLVSLPATIGLGLGLLWATGAPRPLVALTEVQLGYAAFTAVGYALLLLTLVSGKDAA